MVNIINKLKADSPKYYVLLRASWETTWPIMVIMLFSLFMNLTDVYIAGLLGKTVQASVGLANQTYFIFTVIDNAVTIGTIAVISRIFGGNKKNPSLSVAVYTAIVFAIGCAAVVTVIASATGPYAISKMNINADVKQQVIRFIKIYCGGLFFQLMIIHFNGILRACKMVRFSMLVMVGAAILNIILNIIFVFYTPIGSDGIALSTSISWFVSFMIMLPAMYKLMTGEKYFSKEVAKKILSISWPSGIIAFSWQCSSLVLYAIVGMLPERSVEIMAAMTAGLRIESIIFMPAFAFNMASAVLVGNLLGNNKKEDAFTITVVTAAAGMAVIMFITAVVIFFAKPIASILASKNDEGMIDPAVFQEIVTYLRIVMISEPFMALNLIISGALSGAGDTRSLMKYSLFSLWVLRIPVCYVFAIKFGYGAIAIWWAMNITFLSQSFLSGRRFLSKKWFEL